MEVVVTLHHIHSFLFPSFSSLLAIITLCIAYGIHFLQVCEVVCVCVCVCVCVHMYVCVCECAYVCGCIVCNIWLVFLFALLLSNDVLLAESNLACDMGFGGMVVEATHLGLMCLVNQTVQSNKHALLSLPCYAHSRITLSTLLSFAGKKKFAIALNEQDADG